MNFFQKIKASVYSPDFYAGIVRSGLGSALSYFFLLTLSIELVSVAKLAPQLLISSTNQIKAVISSVVDQYPQELVVTLKSGEITTNVKEPYYFVDKAGKRFAVLDTKTPYSAAKFADFGVYAWVTKDTVFYKGDSEGQIKSQNLTQLPDIVINKDFVAALATKVAPWIPFFGPVLLIFMFLVLYIGTMFRLVYLFFLALLIWLLTKIMNRGISYGTAYKVGIYAMTLALMVDLVKTYIGWNGFIFMFTLITLAVVLVNFKALPGVKK